jgi:predicted dehydrogenase
MMKNEFRIRIAGAGFIGEKHAEAWTFVSGARVVAVAEQDERKRRTFAGASDFPMGQKQEKQ